MAAGLGYSAVEASWLTMSNQRIAIPGLPSEFRGLRIVQLTDLHHGPFTGLEFIARAVQLANEQQPDLILLTGDYSFRERKYVMPCIRELGDLRAPLGVYTIPGNHEYYKGIQLYHDSLRLTDIRDLTNQSVILRRRGAELALAGIDDHMMGQPSIERALSNVKSELPTLLMSHNADAILSLSDPRVKLILSGHTHGGQISIPFYGPPYLPGNYQAPYYAGLYQTPTAQIYVSRGIGTIFPPVRFNAPPELTILELDVA
jgi:predicted MPP superfamily phosphohydrolase